MDFFELAELDVETTQVDVHATAPTHLHAHAVEYDFEQLLRLSVVISAHTVVREAVAAPATSIALRRCLLSVVFPPRVRTGQRFIRARHFEKGCSVLLFLCLACPRLDLVWVVAERQPPVRSSNVLVAGIARNA